MAPLWTDWTLEDDGDACYASENLWKAWRSCCDRVLGLYDEEAEMDDEGAPMDAAFFTATEEDGGDGFQIINLLPSEDFKASAVRAMDPWMETACSIDNNIAEMRVWVRKKQHAYVSVLTADEEASLIQSTVTSFTATTANEIESLRRLVGGTSSLLNHHLGQHRTGIVQILLERLQIGVAKPFGLLQKQRSREAVQIWQHPLECRLALGPSASSSLSSPPGGMGGAATPDLRFYPQRPAHRLQRNVWETYQDSLRFLDGTSRPQRPTSRLFSRPPKRTSESAVTDSNSATLATAGSGDRKRIKSDSSHSTAPDPPTLRSRFARSDPTPSRPVPVPDHNDGYGDASLGYYHTAPDVLEREAAQLLLVARSDLDAVQKMEQRMVDITTLLSQFASLVTAQQREVQQIHTDTTDAKDNVAQGQEHLVEAKERTASSRHYTATAIAVLGWLLLFFHWIRP